MPIPAVNTWWPHLSIEAKHALSEHQGETLPDEVREEIARITGETVPEGARLDASDAEFIATQREQVD